MECVNKRNLYLFSLYSYYNNIDELACTPEMTTYTDTFVKTIENIKRRHDPVVTTVAQGILEYKEKHNANLIDTDVQQFLDRFYMSRIGIRMLIGKIYFILFVEGGYSKKKRINKRNFINDGYTRLILI